MERTKEQEEKRDQEIVELIHRNSLRLLKEIGIKFLSDSSLDLLKKNGIRVEGNRAYFTEEQVMDALNRSVRKFTVYARNPKYNVKMNTVDLYTPLLAAKANEAGGQFKSQVKAIVKKYADGGSLTDAPAESEKASAEGLESAETDPSQTGPQADRVPAGKGALPVVIGCGIIVIAGAAVAAAVRKKKK